METKKSKKADLESKRSLFLQFGLVIALGITLTAFNINDSVKSVETLGQLEDVEVDDEIIPITRDEVKPPPPPPPPKLVEVFAIVDDDLELEDEFEIESSEADDETIIDAVPVIREDIEENSDEIFQVVEENPVFPGGEKALISWITKNINYPVIAAENGIQGKVYVNFVVNKDGGISNATIARGVDSSLDKEALRVVNKLPKWKPGKQRGKAVRVSFTVPINFQLQ